MVFTIICSYRISVPVTNTRLILQRRVIINWKGYGRKNLWRNATSNLEEMRKATDNLSENIRRQSRASNRTPPEYKSQALVIEPACSVQSNT